MAVSLFLDTQNPRADPAMMHPSKVAPLLGGSSHLGSGSSWLVSKSWETRVVGPLPNGLFKRLANGGDPSHLLIGMILQVLGVVVHAIICFIRIDVWPYSSVEIEGFYARIQNQQILASHGLFDYPSLCNK